MDYDNQRPRGSLEDDIVPRYNKYSEFGDKSSKLRHHYDNQVAKAVKDNKLKIENIKYEISEQISSQGPFRYKQKLAVEELDKLKKLSADLQKVSVNLVTPSKNEEAFTKSPLEISKDRKQHKFKLQDPPKKSENVDISFEKRNADIISIHDSYGSNNNSSILSGNQLENPIYTEVQERWVKLRQDVVNQKRITSNLQKRSSKNTNFTSNSAKRIAGN